MDKSEILTLAEQFQRKADTAYANYQDTGHGRYLSSYRKNDDTARALIIAANAKDEHDELVALRNRVTEWASAWYEQRSSAPYLMDSVVSYARLTGLVKKL